MESVYLASRSRSAQRLFRALGAYDTELTDTLMGHLRSVILSDEFDAHMCRFTLRRTTRIRDPELGRASFATLLNMGVHLPSPDEIASELVQSRAYYLAPLLSDFNMLPSSVSVRDQDAMILALPSQWTYPDLLAPTLLMDANCTRFLANTLFPKTSHHIEPELIEKIAKFPMCQEARSLFTSAIITQCKVFTGEKRFARTIVHGSGAVGGHLLEAGLIDEAKLEREIGEEKWNAVNAALSVCRSWSLNRNTDPTGLMETKRPRL